MNHSEQRRQYDEKSQNSSAKIAFLVTSWFRQRSSQIDDFEINRLDQTLITFFTGFMFMQGNFFFDLTESVMERIIATGIPQHLMKLHMWVLHKENVKSSRKLPQVLKINDFWLHSLALPMWTVN